MASEGRRAVAKATLETMDTKLEEMLSEIEDKKERTLKAKFARRARNRVQGEISSPTPLTPL